MMESSLRLRGKKFFLYRASLCIARSYFFNGIMVLCIFGNAIVLAMDYFPGDSNREF